jgi:hypothetical protein
MNSNHSRICILIIILEFLIIINLVILIFLMSEVKNRQQISPDIEMKSFSIFQNLNKT